MEIFTELNNKNDLAVILGFFDGLHRGHKTVISKAICYVQKNNLKSALITFNDSPAKIIRNNDIKYILSKSERIKVIENLGVDYLYLLDFNEEFSKITAKDYLKMIVNYLNPKAIITGYNHYFGYNKCGNTDYLNLMQNTYNYEYIEVPSVKIKDNIVSSSKIRQLLSAGEIELANEMLGYKFYVKNKVIRGKQIGRTIGFNTANLLFPKDVIEIPNGVYAVEVQIDEKFYTGIANYGIKPTVENTKEKILEVHILNFNEDIYDKEIKVSFLKKIRNEIKFDSLDDLKTQIKKDIKCLEL
ncbi:bifunctional riboflavin kinase/FAD synthetase [bacterium]|nr:bifunctional riboflavin kinase/FAD synthetase [bacterium]